MLVLCEGSQLALSRRERLSGLLQRSAIGDILVHFVALGRQFWQRVVGEIGVLLLLLCLGKMLRRCVQLLRRILRLLTREREGFFLLMQQPPFFSSARFLVGKAARLISRTHPPTERSDLRLARAQRCQLGLGLLPFAHVGVVLRFTIEHLQRCEVDSVCIVDSLLQALLSRFVCFRQRLHLSEHVLRRLLAKSDEFLKAQERCLRAIIGLELCIRSGDIADAALDAREREIVEARVKNLTQELDLVLRRGNEKFLKRALRKHDDLFELLFVEADEIDDLAIDLADLCERQKILVPDTFEQRFLAQLAATAAALFRHALLWLTVDVETLAADLEGEIHKGDAVIVRL